jgi:hypothetical protein
LPSSDVAVARSTTTKEEAEASSTAANDGDVFWPYTLLPEVIPQANVYTWGYDVDIDHFFSSAGQSSVFQHANSLLSDVADERMPPDSSRPIIFVTHSLGGIVVKEALISSSKEKTRLKDILPATIGVCFLGTPHRGSSSATTGKIAFELSRIFLRSPNVDILRSLERDSENLDRISRHFSQILLDSKMMIHSFSEDRRTKGVMVVETSSYAVGYGLEETSIIPSDHSNMTKFRSRSDIGFVRVSKVLKRWMTSFQSRSPEG